MARGIVCLLPTQTGQVWGLGKQGEKRLVLVVLADSCQVCIYILHITQNAHVCPPKKIYMCDDELLELDFSKCV